MSARQTDAQNLPLPVAIGILATKVDNLTDSMNEVKESLRTQFQTTYQASADRREVLELIAQVRKSQLDGFQQIKDTQAFAARRAEVKLTTLTGLFITVSGGLLITFIVKAFHL